MGTNYFVCGGPYRAPDAEAQLFEGFDARIGLGSTGTGTTTENSYMW